jgi:KRAB domain-containing zinc finger protein
MRVHTNLKPYSCSICTKPFKSTLELSNHRFVHLDERIFKCESCTKTYKRPTQLKQHIKIVHLKIKPHKCDICLLSFGVMCDLKAHKLVHSREKPHSCKICFKKFKHRSTILKHTLKIHEHQSKCRICQEYLESKNSLGEHILKEHGVLKLYECYDKSCDNISPTLQSLQTHTLRHLGMENSETEDDLEDSNQEIKYQWSHLTSVKVDITAASLPDLVNFINI